MVVNPTARLGVIVQGVGESVGVFVKHVAYGSGVMQRGRLSGCSAVNGRV